MKCNKRMMWDDGIASNIETHRPNKNIRVMHLVNKAPLNFKNRDFLDKRIFFKHQGAYYIYITSVPDQVQPATKDLVRSKSIVGSLKIYKTNEGPIKLFACL